MRVSVESYVCIICVSFNCGISMSTIKMSHIDVLCYLLYPSAIKCFEVYYVLISKISCKEETIKSKIAFKSRQPLHVPTRFSRYTLF